MNTKADRPECEYRVELRENEVRSNSGITRKAREKCEAEAQAPPSPLAPLHKFCYYIQMCCDVFCTGHGINRIMCVADAERIGA